MKGPWLKSALKQNDPKEETSTTSKAVATGLSAGAIVPGVSGGGLGTANPVISGIRKGAGGGTGTGLSTAATIPVVGTGNPRISKAKKGAEK